MPNPKSKIPRPADSDRRGGQNPKSAGSLEVMSSSVEETQAFGERLGALLQPGDVVALQGDLGAGKTTLIQGLARGLGRNPDSIKSPTFVLMREYAGDVPLVHIDGYRLEGVLAAAWLDMDVMFGARKITVIEWAERFGGLLPENHIELRLTHKTTNRRNICVIAHGARSAQLIEILKQAVHSPQSTVHSETQEAQEK